MANCIKCKKKLRIWDRFMQFDWDYCRECEDKIISEQNRLREKAKNFRYCSNCSMIFNVNPEDEGVSRWSILGVASLVTLGFGGFGYNKFECPYCREELDEVPFDIIKKMKRINPTN